MLAPAAFLAFLGHWRPAPVRLGFSGVTQLFFNTTKPLKAVLRAHSAFGAHRPVVAVCAGRLGSTVTVVGLGVNLRAPAAREGKKRKVITERGSPTGPGKLALTVWPVTTVM